MKNLSYFTLLVLTVITFASCKGLRHFDYIITPVEPYVITKDGKKYTGTSANRDKRLFVKDKIKLGDTSFLSKNVALYCDGDYTYANVMKNIFAIQVASGPINVYKSVSISDKFNSNNNLAGINNMGSSVSSNMNGIGNHTTEKHISYFIQQEGKLEFKSLNYKNMVGMVPPNSPGYDILKKYKAKSKTRQIIKYGSLGIIVAGAAIAGSNAEAGVGIITAGLVGEIVALCKRINNNKRLYDAIVLIDSMPDKQVTPSHKRVQ